MAGQFDRSYRCSRPGSGAGLARPSRHRRGCYWKSHVDSQHLRGPLGALSFTRYAQWSFPHWHWPHALRRLPPYAEAHCRIRYQACRLLRCIDLQSRSRYRIGDCTLSGSTAAEDVLFQCLDPRTIPIASISVSFAAAKSLIKHVVHFPFAP